MNNTEIRRAQLELYVQIPVSVRFGLVHHIVFGYPLGDFLRAVFLNDLHETFSRADEHSRRGLHALVTWIHSFAPSVCWGSKEALASWREKREELLPGCYSLTEGLAIFAELGDSVAEEALAALKTGVFE